jgi:dihydrofolate synthase/folylpolyglutamate synthase
MGFARDKDLGKILPMLPKEAHYIFTQAKTDRAVVAEELLQLAAEHGLQGEAVADVKQALERARELATPADMIFVGGSTYVVGEVL